MLSQKSKVKVRGFRKVIWDHYRSHGRHDLPWRKTTNAYKILVSEVMLQQTGVVRVIDKYKSFLKKFPTVERLATASLSDVLKEWSGLGYNRRGKYLHDAAKVIMAKYGGKVPQDFAALKRLPGVGDYTAKAVRVFAFDEHDVLIETNIRAAIIHAFFVDTLKIRDRDILVYAEKLAEGQDPRAWHWALMDYGAHLKKSGVRNNHRSAHYAKQSKFEGSLRQVRGILLKFLAEGPKAENKLNVGFTKSHIQRALLGLEKDGLIKKVRPSRIGLGPKKEKWRIA